MTRASDCRPPSSDLITREWFFCQRPLLTTRAPRRLIFSVNASSVEKGGSGLVSITARAAAFRSSDRTGRIAHRTCSLLRATRNARYYSTARAKVSHLVSRRLTANVQTYGSGGPNEVSSGVVQ